MADQDVAVEGNAHSVAGQVVGRDLLLRLQLDPGREMAAVVAELFRPGPGVVAAFEQQESVLPERLQRHGRDGGLQMAAVFDVGEGEGIALQPFVGGKMAGHCQEQMLLTEKRFFVYRRIHGLIVDQEVQESGEEPLLQFGGGGLHQVHMNQGILLGEPGEQGRQHIGGEEVGAPDGDGAAFQAPDVIHVIAEAFLHVHDVLHGADVLLPQLGEPDGIGAAVEDGKADLGLRFFYSGAQGGLADEQVFGGFREAHFSVDLIDVVHSLEHNGSPLFPRAMSQAAVLARPVGECREGQITKCPKDTFCSAALQALLN